MYTKSAYYFEQYPISKGSDTMLDDKRIFFFFVNKPICSWIILSSEVPLCSFLNE